MGALATKVSGPTTNSYTPTCARKAKLIPFNAYSCHVPLDCGSLLKLDVSFFWYDFNLHPSIMVYSVGNQGSQWTHDFGPKSLTLNVQDLVQKMTITWQEVPQAVLEQAVVPKINRQCFGSNPNPYQRAKNLEDEGVGSSLFKKHSHGHQKQCANTLAGYCFFL